MGHLLTSITRFDYGDLKKWEVFGPSGLPEAILFGYSRWCRFSFAKTQTLKFQILAAMINSNLMQKDKNSKASEQTN